MSQPRRPDTRDLALRRRAIRDRIDQTGETWADAAQAVDAERAPDPQPADPPGGQA